MTTLEIIETTFKALQKRTDDAFETVQGINKQHAKTTSGMNSVVDTIREMREKVRNLMSLQDDIAHQFKNVDKLVMGNVPDDFEPIKRVKKETKRSSFDEDMDYKPASKVKFDALSDDEDFISKPKKEPVKFDELSDDEPLKDDSGANERAAAIEEAKKLDAEFEADEAALEAEEAQEVDEEAEARKIAELELQQLAEEEAKLAEEELRRLEEEEKRLAEEEELRLAEEEELRLAEEEELRLAEEEELRRLEEEEELKRLQEEEAALKAEEEELRRLEEEEAAAKEAEEEAAKKAAEEEAKKKAPPKGKPGKFQFGNQLKSGGNKNKVVFK